MSQPIPTPTLERGTDPITSLVWIVMVMRRTCWAALSLLITTVRGMKMLELHAMKVWLQQHSIGRGYNDQILRLQSPPVTMEMWGWSMDLWIMKEEWRYVIMEAGEQSAIITLMIHSLVLSAGNWLEKMHVAYHEGMTTATQHWERLQWSNPLSAESPCNHGDVRLVNGFMDYEGRVEICDNGSWGTVCYYYSYDTLPSIVCRQLAGENACKFSYTIAVKWPITCRIMR